MKVINGFIDHDLVKISIYVVYIIFSNFKWRARHHTLVVAAAVTDNVNDTVETLEHLPRPDPR